MVATPLSIQSITRGGVEPVAEVSPNTTDGNTYPNNGATWIEVTNGNVGSSNVTVDYAATVDGQTIPAKSFAIAATKKRRIDPFPVNLFGSTVKVHCPSGVTVAAWQLS